MSLTGNVKVHFSGIPRASRLMVALGLDSVERLGGILRQHTAMGVGFV